MYVYNSIPWFNLNATAYQMAEKKNGLLLEATSHAPFARAEQSCKILCKHTARAIVGVK
jgi:hypothetical protein